MRRPKPTEVLRPRMTPTRQSFIGTLLLACAAAFGTASAEPAAALRLVSRTPLPEYAGDFDHLSADLVGQRLFLAGEDGGTVEVFNLRNGRRLRTIKGFEAPHAVHLAAGGRRLIVSDSGDGLSKVLNAKTYAVTGTLNLTPGADVMSFDASTGHLWFVTGGKNATRKLPTTTLVEVDPQNGKVLGQLDFETDFTEGIAFEQRGPRAFVNVAGLSLVAVVDKRSHQILARWPVNVGQNNSAIALDEANGRLFIITRKPFKLAVLDTQNGAMVASFDAPPRSNELMWDAVNRRIYVAGDGHVAVFKQRSANAYEELARVPSAHGAKTGLYVPQLRSLFIAVSPGDRKGVAELLKYEVLPDAVK